MSQLGPEAAKLLLPMVTAASSMVGAQVLESCHPCGHAFECHAVAPNVKKEVDSIFSPFSPLATAEPPRFPAADTNGWNSARDQAKASAQQSRHEQCFAAGVNLNSLSFNSNTANDGGRALHTEQISVSLEGSQIKPPLRHEEKFSQFSSGTAAGEPFLDNVQLYLNFFQQDTTVHQDLRILHTRVEADDPKQAVFIEGALADCQTHPCELGQSCSYWSFSLWCTDCTGADEIGDGITCQTCGAGEQPNSAHTACIPCAGATYSPSGQCISCDAPLVVHGARPLAAPRTSCAACPKGKAPNSDRDGCNVCPPGLVSNTGVNCTFCRKGSEPALEQDRCIGCQVGTFSVEGIRCEDCHAGKFSGAEAYKCDSCRSLDTATLKYYRSPAMNGTSCKRTVICDTYNSARRGDAFSQKGGIGRKTWPVYYRIFGRQPF
eukprot:COSAG05_NODE_2296_length_3264_cov_2.037283_1_plen_434_part_00